jgi:ribosome-associated protein
MDIESTLKVGRHLVIPTAELEWRFSASGGPGGQHANTANTRAELIFDVAGSAVLGPRQRARLLERLEPSARVVVVDESSSRGQPARWSGRGTLPAGRGGEFVGRPLCTCPGGPPLAQGSPTRTDLRSTGRARPRPVQRMCTDPLRTL